jgi:hypothetical protein
MRSPRRLVVEGGVCCYANHTSSPETVRRIAESVIVGVISRRPCALSAPSMSMPATDGWRSRHRARSLTARESVSHVGRDPLHLGRFRAGATARRRYDVKERGRFQRPRCAVPQATVQGILPCNAAGCRVGAGKGSARSPSRPNTRSALRPQSASICRVCCGAATPPRFRIAALAFC